MAVHQHRAHDGFLELPHPIGPASFRVGKRACLNAIDYPAKFGDSPEQAYTTLGSAPIKGHHPGVVDIPNYYFTAHLPTVLFDPHVRLSAVRPSHIDWGRGAPKSNL